MLLLLSFPHPTPRRCLQAMSAVGMPSTLALPYALPPHLTYPAILVRGRVQGITACSGALAATRTVRGYSGRSLNGSPVETAHPRYPAIPASHLAYPAISSGPASRAHPL